MPTHRIILIKKGCKPAPVEGAEYDSYAEAEVHLTSFQAWRVEGEEYVIDEIIPPPPSESAAG